MMPSCRWNAAVLMALLILYGCHASYAGAEERATVNSMPPGTHLFRVTVKGVERRYLLHIPPAYTPANKWPVVVMFHGGGGTARSAMRETGWTEKADKEGFLAVFPEGTPLYPTRPARFRDNPQTWNDGSKRGVADVEFVTMMLADLKVRFSVDERRVYATGFSNGASMTFRWRASFRRSSPQRPLSPAPIGWMRRSQSVLYPFCTSLALPIL